MNTIQFFLTPAAGKQLIADALSAREDIKAALREHTVVIVAGSTNGYVAQSLLQSIGQAEDFCRGAFYRGLLKPDTAKASRPAYGSDIVIRRGEWIKGQNIFDCAGELKQEDIILKGANAVHLASGEAGVLAGNPTSGTIGPIYSAVMGRRVKLVLPVGVEKRVEEPIAQLARLNNGQGAAGCRLCPAPGEVYTELDAIRDLCGAEAHITAGGGVCGYEGGCLFTCTGTKEQLDNCREQMKRIAGTPAFEI